MAKTCPKCGLYNPPEAARCDCGYDFDSGRMRSSYLVRDAVEKAGGSAASIAAASRSDIRTGVIILSFGAALGIATYAVDVPRFPILFAVFGFRFLFRGLKYRRQLKALEEESTAPEPRPSEPRDEWTIDGIAFDTRGWRLVSASTTSMTWHDADGSELVLVPVSLDASDRHHDVESARAFYRQASRRDGGGIVSVERSVGSVPALEVITKRPRGSGYEYVGSLILSPPAQQYEIRMRADEGSLTGVREAVVAAQMGELGEVRLGSATSAGGRAIEGWFHDPYDAQFDAGAVNSVTDDQRLDVLFPNHPLSRIRRALGHAVDTLELSGGDVGAATEEESRDAALDHLDGPRRLLSNSVVRELLAKHARTDLVENLGRESAKAAPTR